MSRREFISLASSAAIAWPLAARAQQPAMPVVGVHRSGGAPNELLERVTRFRQGLKQAGFVEGENVAIKDRDETDMLPLVVADLVRQDVALIVGNTPVALAAKAATSTIPIIFVTGADPVQFGLVASLNRPGGNVTGISFMSVELTAKQLGLLRELRPAASRIAVLLDPKFPTTERFVSEVHAAASAVGEQVELLYVGSDREIETAFTTLAQRRADALLVGTGEFMTSNRKMIVALAARHKIPAMYILREYAEAGGLMSYGTSVTEAWRRAGIYAGRILKGEKPGDLPVMLPTKFEFVINLKTANALGLTFPPGLLAIADEVIE
jgi:putative ABC transport system substrate-binding protein